MMAATTLVALCCLLSLTSGQSSYPGYPRQSSTSLNSAVREQNLGGSGAQFTSHQIQAIKDLESVDKQDSVATQQFNRGAYVRDRGQGYERSYAYDRVQDFRDQGVTGVGTSVQRSLSEDSALAQVGNSAAIGQFQSKDSSTAIGTENSESEGLNAQDERILWETQPIAEIPLYALALDHRNPPLTKPEVEVVPVPLPIDRPQIPKAPEIPEAPTVPKPLEGAPVPPPAPVAPVPLPTPAPLPAPATLPVLAPHPLPSPIQSDVQPAVPTTVQKPVAAVPVHKLKPVPFAAPVHNVVVSGPGSGPAVHYSAVQPHPQQHIVNHVPLHPYYHQQYQYPYLLTG